MKISKKIALTLSLACWFAVFFNYAAEYTRSAAQTAIAFSTSDIPNPNDKLYTVQINDTTYELKFNTKEAYAYQQNNLFRIIFNYLYNYDNNIKLISSKHAKGYTDYYLYSSKLYNISSIEPLSGGFNIHIVITDKCKTYLGVPCINYDF